MGFGKMINVLQYMHKEALLEVHRKDGITMTREEALAIIEDLSDEEVAILHEMILSLIQNRVPAESHRASSPATD